MADTYRGFDLEYYLTPIPIRAHDWTAAPVDYDFGDPILTGPTREAVCAEVDRWWDEEAEDYPGIVERASRAGKGEPSNG